MLREDLMSQESSPILGRIAFEMSNCQGDFANRFHKCTVCLPEQDKIWILEQIVDANAFKRATGIPFHYIDNAWKAEAFSKIIPEEKLQFFLASFFQKTKATGEEE